jgi:hypothetical protein
MNRQSIGNGQWFDLDSAHEWEEDTYWNGSNHISSATGSQWDHQTLYRSKKGKYILFSWSQRQGVPEVWSIISDEEAARWLTDNKKDFPDGLSHFQEELEV